MTKKVHSFIMRATEWTAQSEREIKWDINEQQSL